MASVKIKINSAGLKSLIENKLSVLHDNEKLFRQPCFDLIDLMTKRIHEDGKDSSGKGIGEYSDRYLQLRVEKFSRKPDKKIIVSLTSQLENDWSVVATKNGYGIGFLNALNLKKARWVEAGQGKKIFSMTKSEKEYVTDSIRDIVKKEIGK